MASSPIPRIPLDPDGRMWALVLGVVCAVAFCMSIWWLWIPAVVLLTIVLLFFRDPPRRAPKIPGAIVSPADGRVVSIHTNEDPSVGPVGGPCVAVFLAVWDVHVNRAPYDGRIELIRYQPGLHLDARNPESSSQNESNWIYLQCKQYSMTVKQIAGLIARRVVCRVEEGQSVRRGQRIGLIRFGSRTELYLPPEARLQVQIDQVVRGGETVIAYLPEEPETSGA